MFKTFEFLNLDIVSNFDIRISNLSQSSIAKQSMK